MALARLVVVEGPDVGREFAVPMRGGGLGRGEDSAVQLTDLAVSRAHCRLELREGRLALVDHGSRNRTLVNGRPITVHVLSEGDEISIGHSRLVFLPADVGVAMLRPPAPSRLTIEVGTMELLRAGRDEDRARRHLASLASLGDTVRSAGDRAEVGRAACEAARAALLADRAFLLVRDGAGGVSPSAAAIAPGDPAGTRLALARDVIDKVLGELKAVAVAAAAEPDERAALLAPIAFAAGSAAGGAAPLGLLYVDRRGGGWDEIDLMAVAGIANLLSAALEGAGAREALERENRDLADRLGGNDFIGSSPEAQALLAFVAKVGPSDATVLLTGESGSGKEMVARAVHRASRRRRRPFVAVNCAALTETLIESELFGHEKGAFTGAAERKIGRFEAADKGTLFLDEVGELPLSCQTKFLRVLEEQTFERVGGTRPIAVDVRVVAATNRDLGEMVRRGGFREDLFYRLSVIHTEVPPLRARPGDIPELARHFLARLGAQATRRVSGFTPEALRALCAHPWPGNVRELRNAIERAIVLGEGGLLRREDLPPPIANAAIGAPAPLAGGVPLAEGAVVSDEQPARPRSLKELERAGIVAALEATGGNKAQAAQILEIDRSTLYKKIRDYGIEV